MKVLSAALLAVLVAVLASEAEEGESESGRDNVEASVDVEVDAEADEAAGEWEEAGLVEYGEESAVSAVADRVRGWLVRGVVERAALRPFVDALECGSGTADERRGRMVVSVCCHCCKLCSCLAVSSAIESINASILSAFLYRDDDVGPDKIDDDDTEADEDEGDDELGCERAAGRTDEAVLAAVGAVEDWYSGGSDTLSLCSSVS